jgi:hypothetical protein
MKITAATAAALAILTDTLDEDGADIAHSLRRLTADAAAAVPSYVGLSVIVPQGNPPLAITTLADGAFAGDVRTSLHVLLPGISDGHDPPRVALILYAGTPGTFIDLAADLTWLTGRPLTDVTFDQHLTIPTEPDPAALMQAMSDINQAIGIRIGHGETLQQAESALEVQAADNHTDRQSAARLILDKATTCDDDGHSGIH